MPKPNLKRAKRSTQMKAQYALSKALDRLDARDSAGVISILEPALRQLQEIDAYEDLQAVLCLQIATAHALARDFDKADYRLHMAYMLAQNEALQQTILEQRDNIFGHAVTSS